MDVDPHRQRAAVGVPELRGDVRRRPTVAATGADGV
jgi:hypothetical protein